MSPSVILLIVFTGAVCTSAATPSHEYRFIYGCYESGEVRVDLLLDWDVVVYADFSKKEDVSLIPRLPQSAKYFKEMAFGIAENAVVHCRANLDKMKKVSPGAAIPQEAPDISIYSRYEGHDGVANTLFCLADHFYPPSVNFTWTKNEVKVTDGVSDLRYSHNGDGTFHRISALSFTPREGDVYSCSVEHQASHPPLARTWELKESPSRVRPAARFFGASLVLCLIGIGTGAYFFIKQTE